MHRGTDPIAEDLLPKRYSLAKYYQSLGDIIDLGYAIAVSPPLLKLIADLEPGRHQIWPVEIIQRSGEAYPTEYFMLRVLSQLDPFDKEKSPQGKPCTWNCFVAQCDRGSSYLARTCHARDRHFRVQFLCVGQAEGCDSRGRSENAAILSVERGLKARLRGGHCDAPCLRDYAASWVGAQGGRTGRWFFLWRAMRRLAFVP